MDLLEKAKTRLEGIGITADDLALSFAAGKVEEHIKNFCNVEEVPEGLEYAATDMACGEYLNQLLLLGKLDAETFPVNAAVKSIDEGDVKITFMDNTSAEDKLTAYIQYLLNHENDLITYRRLRW